MIIFTIAKGLAAVGKYGGRFRIKFDCQVKVGDRADVIAFLSESEASIVQSFYVVGADSDRLVVLINRGIDVAFLR